MKQKKTSLKMINTAQNQYMALNILESSIIKTLLYFDIFSYPLCKEEILKYAIPANISDEEITGTLNRLVAQKCIFMHDDFYSVRLENSINQRRVKGNIYAQKILKTAKWVSAFIAYFPFVRGVYISGTLAKGYADKKSDIDYFIITEPGRLWIARTFLIAFKKVFLLNSRKYFCVNYFIDSKHLEISDKNMYTAVELLTLIPMYNFKLFDQFLTTNKWTDEYFPNYKKRHSFELNQTLKVPYLKKLIEKLLSGKAGEWMDNHFMKITGNRLKKKFSEFNEKEFELALRTKKFVSKHHPQNYQKNVLDTLKEKITDYENEFNVTLING